LTARLRAGPLAARNRQEEAMFCLRQFLQLTAFATAFAAVLGHAAPASAQTIIDEWKSVQAPAVPELKSVTIDSKTTALLMNDFVKQACNQQRRPRCLATLPKAKALLAEARAKGIFVVYSIVKGGAAGDTLPEVARTGNEPVVESGVDKFFRTDLEQILKDKGIQTLIVAGTGANGGTRDRSMPLGIQMADSRSWAPSTTRKRTRSAGSPTAIGSGASGSVCTAARRGRG